MLADQTEVTLKMWSHFCTWSHFRNVCYFSPFYSTISEGFSWSCSFPLCSTWPLLIHSSVHLHCFLFHVTFIYRSQMETMTDSIARLAGSWLINRIWLYGSKFIWTAGFARLKLKWTGQISCKTDQVTGISPESFNGQTGPGQKHESRTISKWKCIITLNARSPLLLDAYFT